MHISFLMEQSKVLEKLIDKKKFAVIKHFILHRDKQLYLAEISKSAQVPIATTYRILQQFVDSNLINQTKISKFRIYQLAKNENTEFLESILREEKKLVEEFVNKTKEIQGVQRILLHGKESYNKASIIIIGREIDAEKIKIFASEIKQNYKFIITYLILTEEQFQQMKNLGLFSRELRVLSDKSL